ncbi:hypothetical protein [Cohnella sp. REN36]|uniref:hypothetical protein n=1 Tax=Cohnella sp. REN36 TaxID=2887347 RepID=UPI001D140591|nr:hypothetical protein [Cohnella sp. REN36]MCC3374672.1 hypothetical protein [Cohnella sp. REN36]
MEEGPERLPASGRLAGSARLTERSEDHMSHIQGGRLRAIGSAVIVLVLFILLILLLLAW